MAFLAKPKNRGLCLSSQWQGNKPEAKNQNKKLNALPTLEGKGQAYNTKQTDNRAASPSRSAEPTLENLSFEHRSAVAHDPL